MTVDPSVLMTTSQDFLTTTTSATRPSRSSPPPCVEDGAICRDAGHAWWPDGADTHDGSLPAVGTILQSSVPQAVGRWWCEQCCGERRLIRARRRDLQRSGSESRPVRHGHSLGRPIRSFRVRDSRRAVRERAQQLRRRAFGGKFVRQHGERRMKAVDFQL